MNYWDKDRVHTRVYRWHDADEKCDVMLTFSELPPNACGYALEVHKTMSRCACTEAEAFECYQDT